MTQKLNLINLISQLYVQGYVHINRALKCVNKILLIDNLKVSFSDYNLGLLKA